MRKTKKTYYFSVEGETEAQYLSWLQKQINNLDSATFSVKFDTKVCPNARSRAKNLNPINPINVTHVIDIEGKKQSDIDKFEKSLDYMKEAENLGKKITYNLAYSNLSFELWILLHKVDCYNPFTNNKAYLKLINSNFDQTFSRLKEYKKKENFELILSKLCFEEVKVAINRAKKIEE
jgi:hypothetical protein